MHARACAETEFAVLPPAWPAFLRRLLFRYCTCCALCIASLPHQRLEKQRHPGHHVCSPHSKLPFVVPQLVLPFHPRLVYLLERPCRVSHPCLFVCSSVPRSCVMSCLVRYGVVSVRGAEVYELADEEGNLLNDPATQKERVSHSLRYSKPDYVCARPRIRLFSFSLQSMKRFAPYTLYVFRKTLVGRPPLMCTRPNECSSASGSPSSPPSVWVSTQVKTIFRKGRHFIARNHRSPRAVDIVCHT